MSDCKHCFGTGRVERLEYDAASGDMEHAGTDPCPHCEQKRQTHEHVLLIARLSELAEDYEQAANCDNTPAATRKLLREFATDIRDALSG